MALGSTDISIRGGIYGEMSKNNSQSNVSLGQAKYGANDIDNGAFAVSNPSMVKMSYWQNYDHKNLQFRYNGSQTLSSETYKHTDPDYFGIDGAGVPVTLTGAIESGSALVFDGVDDYAEFDAVSGSISYKVSPSGTGVIAFWVYPQDNSAGQTAILNTDAPIGSLTVYRGYRFDIRHDTFKIRILRGDGTGNASQHRRTFESVSPVVQNEWNFIAWQGVANGETINTSNNYLWIWNNTNGWQNGVSFLSGTGGQLNYSTTDKLCLSPASNQGRYFQGKVRNIHAFGQIMTDSDIQALKDNTIFF